MREVHRLRIGQSPAKRGGLWSWPALVVHRGGGLLAPENTRAGFAESARRGYRAVETDVMLARDGVLMLSHDEVLGRTVAAVGRVSEMTSSELIALDAGSAFDARFAGEPMMRFADAYRFCRAHGLWMNIEIKPAEGADRATALSLARELEALGREAKEESIEDSIDGKEGLGKPQAQWSLPLVSSFSRTALAVFRAAAPVYPCGLLTEGHCPDAIEASCALGCVSWHADVESVRAEDVKRAHAQGLAVMVYTVDDAACARALRDMEVDALCTNRPDVVGAVFNEV